MNTSGYNISSLSNSQSNLQFNLNNNKPLIPNANTYFEDSKFVHISSGDRNFNKYPQASKFEIMLPSDITNITSVQLVGFTIPLNDDVFSQRNNNLQLVFTVYPFEYAGGRNNYSNLTINKANGVKSILISNEYIDLINSIIGDKKEIILSLAPGTYENDELTHQISCLMNIYMNNLIIEHIDETNESIYIPYEFFYVYMNKCSLLCYLINTLNPFELNNDSTIYDTNKLVNDIFASPYGKLYSQYQLYGLPGYIGFDKCPVASIQVPDIFEILPLNNVNPQSFQQIFSILGVNTFMNGTTEQVIPINCIKSPFKFHVNISNNYIMLNIPELNCGDSTALFSNKRFEKVTNENNGLVDSFFGLMPLVINGSKVNYSSTGNIQPYSFFSPPLERLRKLSISINYHDGTLVDTGLNDWNITLLFNMLTPRQNLTYTSVSL
jgi:hypothetical protein